MGGDLILRKIIENIKGNKKEHWITAIIGLFFGTICSVFVNVFFHFDEVPLNFWSTIIAALITVFGVGATIYATSRNLEKNMSKQDDRAKKNLEAQKNSLEKQLKLQEQIKHYEIEANIISKARIEWIQEARNITLEYLTICEKIVSLDKISEDTESYSIRLRDLDYNLKMTFLKFKLFLGADRYGDENESFLKKMNKALEINDYNIRINKEYQVGHYFGDKQFKDLYDYVYETPAPEEHALDGFIEDLFEKCTNEIIDYARNYYKKEWIRVSTRDKDKDKDEDEDEDK